jgi:protein-S-isoprenylcysteine O-methyltransferase Ste14
VTDSSPPRHAGVHFPPPILYVAGIVAGMLLDRWRPLRIADGWILGRVAITVISFAVFAALFVGAFSLFLRARTAIIPNRPASVLVTDGPYRFTRNPMYVSMVALYVGVTMVLNSWWPLMLLPIVVLAVDRMVIAREERYLADAFPSEYDAYRARVRRWI